MAKFAGVAAIAGCLLLAPLHAVPSAEIEPVTFVSRARDGATITGHLAKPAAAVQAGRKVPAIVALHGCGGLWRISGRGLSSRHADWAQRLVAEGYVVLLPDSFRSRGIETVCETREQHEVYPHGRAGDTIAAAEWLAEQTYVDKDRMAVLGWSHGGSSTLWSIGGPTVPVGFEFKAAIAFYPGCRVLQETAAWKPRVPLTILIGDADNWTPPAPCRALAERHAVRLIEYPGAVHGFDAPNQPRQTRTGVAYSARGDGKVEIGTDPAARAAAITAVARILTDAFR